MTRRTTRGIAAGIAVIAAIAAVWWWRHRAPEGFIVNLVALDDGTALVVWRANYDHDPSREWLAHMSHTGALDWSRELPGLTAQHGVLVVGDVIAVRYTRIRGFDAIEDAVAGFARRGGEQIWDRMLSPLAPGTHQGAEPISFFPAFAAGGTLIEQVLAHGADSRVLTAIDPRTGELLGKATLGSDEPVGPIAIGNRVVLHFNASQITVVDTSHGIAVTQVPVGGGGVRYGCIIGDDYVAFDDTTAALVGFRGADPASRHVIAHPFRPVDGYFTARTCGHQRDRMVFAIIENGVDHPASKTSIAIVDSHGAVISTIAMPFSSGWGQVNLTQDPETFAFSGALPRFVPYLSLDDTKRDDRDAHLAMVDLEQASVSWVAKMAFDLPDEVFRHDDRWYLDNSVTGGVVMAFDGTSGALVAAVDGGNPILPSHVAGGTLWRFSSDWSRLDKAPLAALDAKTLAPIFARGIAITDVTKQTRDALGIP
jgi:hypothetical protein